MTVKLHPYGKLLKKRIRAYFALAILSPYIEPLLSRTKIKWRVAGSISTDCSGFSSSRITRSLATAAAYAPSSKFGVKEIIPATSSGNCSFLASISCGFSISLLLKKT